MTFVWHFACHLVYLLPPRVFIWNLLVTGNLELGVFFPLCLGGCTHQTQVMWSPCCSLSLIPIFSATVCLFVLFKCVCVCVCFQRQYLSFHRTHRPCTDTVSAFPFPAFHTRELLPCGEPFYRHTHTHTRTCTLAYMHTCFRFNTISFQRLLIYRELCEAALVTMHFSWG